MSKKHKLILETIEGSIANFFNYDRLEDEELKKDEIEQAIDDKIISVDEITNTFCNKIYEHLGMNWKL
jgi:hypothetical protein